MKRPIRVLYFVGDLNPGGSEFHLGRLLLHLDRSRIHPSLLLMRAEGPRLDDIRASGLTVHDLRSGAGFGALVRRILRVRSALKQLSPDVIHAYGYPCDIYATLLTLPRSRRLVVTSRRGNQENPRIWRLYRMTNPLVNRVVCVSRATAEFAFGTEKLSPQRSLVIPNGIDATQFATIQPPLRPMRTIGTLGRLRQVKGIDLLVEAFERLRRPDLMLRIGGPADSAWGLEFQARHAQSRGVTFEGTVTDVPRFLSSIDLFVLPSRSEGMSNALLEAMAGGLPIVATDVGSNGELLDDGRTGVLVRPEAAAIAEGIASLLDQPQRAAELARAARQRVEAEYTLTAMVRRYEDFYERLVEERGL